MLWTVRLAFQAEQDLSDILRWTAANFGSQQAEVYAQTLSQAIEALQAGPQVLGAKVRHDIGMGVRVLHVARQGRQGRHFIAFRVSAEPVIDVLRVLHDSMDLVRRLSGGDPTDP